MVVRRGQKTDNEGQQGEEDGWHSWRLPDPISSPAPLCEGGRCGRRGSGHLRGATQEDGLGWEGGAREGAWLQGEGAGSFEVTGPMAWNGQERRGYERRRGY